MLVVSLPWVVIDTYLEDIWPGPSDVTGNRLDKSWHFGHHVDAVQSLAQGPFQLGVDILQVIRAAIPHGLDGGRLWPVTFRILSGRSMRDRGVGTGVENLAILDNPAHIDNRGVVGWRSSKLHHESGISRGLEVDKVPSSSYLVRTHSASMVELTSVMRLHALESLNEHSPTRKVKGLILGLDGALHRAARPEGMAH